MILGERPWDPRRERGRAVGIFVVLMVLPLSISVTAAAATVAVDAQARRVDLKRFADSVHGGLECADCHMQPDGQAVACGACHDDEVRWYDESIHGQARHGGMAGSPGCQDCHGGVHALRPHTDVDSPVHASRQPDTCGTCHSDPELTAKLGMPRAHPIEAYKASVHARGMQEGNKGATCSDCHGSHAIFPPSDRRSRVNHWGVPATCGTCHETIAATYRTSVHGEASAHGIRESPVCTDCHGEHRILSPDEKGSPVFASNIPKMTCGRCHGDLRLVRKFGLSTKSVPTYKDSYHGLAVRAGSLSVAQCASCHGVHDILPSSDPRSHTNKRNLPRTCGRCHPGAGTSFAIGPIHLAPVGRAQSGVRYVRLFYLWLIGLVVPAMFVHNLLDLVRKARSRQPFPPSSVVGSEERMMLGFRIAHAALLASFAVLVYTGFSLTYPESWWARPVLQWEETFDLRGWIHRGAAIALLASIGFHLIHLLIDRQARLCIAGMRPRLADWEEFTQRVRYLVGMRKDPPPGRRIGYAEKIEYFSLMWGMAVMALSGFILWFENLSLRWLPKWVTDVATSVHFYEAVLATPAILVWHLYFVVFDPLVYPMDRAWITGRPPAARQQERRPHAPAFEAPGRIPESTGKRAG